MTEPEAPVEPRKLTRAERERLLLSLTAWGVAGTSRFTVLLLGLLFVAALPLALVCDALWPLVMLVSAGAGFLLLSWLMISAAFRREIRWLASLPFAAEGYPEVLLPKGLPEQEATLVFAGLPPDTSRVQRLLDESVHKTTVLNADRGRFLFRITAQTRASASHRRWLHEWFHQAAPGLSELHAHHALERIHFSLTSPCPEAAPPSSQGETHG